MILDWKNDREHADRFEILDADTFQPLPMDGPDREIFYADDARGILRRLKLNAEGRPFVAYEGTHTPVRDEDWWERQDEAGNTLNTPMEIAWEEVRQRIRIVPKAAAEKHDRCRS